MREKRCKRYFGFNFEQLTTIIAENKTEGPQGSTGILPTPSVPRECLRENLGNFREKHLIF